MAPSKYLGHYVAGNLAARYGIAIQLHPGHPRGTIATVDLPVEVTEAPPRFAQGNRLVGSGELVPARGAYGQGAPVPQLPPAALPRPAH